MEEKDMHEVDVETSDVVSVESDYDGDACVLRVVEEAAPHRIAIDGEIAERKREILRQYVEMRIKSDYEMKSIWNKRKRDRTDDEKEQLKTFVKTVRKEYKTLCSLLFPSNPMSNPMNALASKVALVVRMLRYIGCTGFDNVLAQNGMTIETRSLEDESDFWKESGSHDLATDIFQQTEAAFHEEENEKTQIRDVKYSELPEEYIKTPENPKGISVSQFAKLVKMKSIAMVSSEDRFTEYKERAVEKDANAVASAETSLELMKTI